MLAHPLPMLRSHAPDHALELLVIDEPPKGSQPGGHVGLKTAIQPAEKGHDDQGFHIDDPILFLPDRRTGKGQPKGVPRALQTLEDLLFA